MLSAIRLMGYRPVLPTLITQTRLLRYNRLPHPNPLPPKPNPLPPLTCTQGLAQRNFCRYCPNVKQPTSEETSIAAARILRSRTPPLLGPCQPHLIMNPKLFHPQQTTQNHSPTPKQKIVEVEKATIES